MAKFRQKDFTIQEGHYTGPKDMDKVPGVLEMVGKSAAIGAGIGSVAGGLMKDQTMLSGALEGGKFGSISGIILKFFLNYLHNPMSKVKYQEVDRNLRKEFGVIRVSGITVGDTLSKRAEIDEKFGFNDRKVTDYKISFAIQDNTVTMYTLDLTEKELDRLSKILDYYCKKYFSMEYNSSVINSRLNSYAVSIVFTNYQVISNFIMEVSNDLGYKINLLNCKAVVSSRLADMAPPKVEELDERQFSAKSFNKYDLIKLLTTTGTYNAISTVKLGRDGSAANLVMTALLFGLEKLTANELIKTGTPVERENMGNIYLEETLKKFRLIENFDYTMGSKSAPVQMSMYSGKFILSALRNSEAADKIDANVYNKFKLKFTKSETADVVVYTYVIQSRSEFDLIIKKLMNLDLKPNVFEK